MDQATLLSFRDQYDAARTRAAVVDRSARGRLTFTGPDRRTFLHALFTNDIAALEAGSGCYTAYLTPQGRMIADFWVYELGDAILLAFDRPRQDDMLSRFDQLIFAEDVQVRDSSDEFWGTALVGPDAAGIVADVLHGASKEELQALSEHGNRRVQFDGESATVLRITDIGEPGYEILIPQARKPALERALSRWPRVGSDVAETLRIESGLPKFLVDMTEETIPLEAGIESRAISMTKGCYVGQEVIVRVLHRGHGRVAEKLVLIAFENGSAPLAGTAIRVNGQDAGRVTSSAMSPVLEKPIALAYLKRTLAAAGTQVEAGSAVGVVREGPVTDRLRGGAMRPGS